MTKLFQMLVAMLLVSVSGSVFAQAGACIPAPMLPGQPQRCYDGRIIPPINAIAGHNPYQGVMGQNIIPSNAVYVPQGQSAPSGYCSWGDRLINIGVSTGVGAILGNLFGGDKKATAVGGATGGLAGVFIPCNQVPTRVVQPIKVVPNQTGTVSGGQTITAPAKCVVGGDDFGDISESSCLKIRDRLTITPSSEMKQVPASISRVVVPAGNPAVNGVDLWKWKSPLATPQNPLPCVVEKITHESKPVFCSELKVLTPKTGENRSEWAIRAESF